MPIKADYLLIFLIDKLNYIKYGQIKLSRILKNLCLLPRLRPRDGPGHQRLWRGESAEGAAGPVLSAQMLCPNAGAKLRNHRKDKQ